MSRLYVGNLNSSITKQRLTDTFIKHGPLVDVWYNSDKCYAFVEFEEGVDAQDAIRQLNKSRLLGLELKVELSKYKRNSGGSPVRRERRLTEPLLPSNRLRSRSFERPTSPPLAIRRPSSPQRPGHLGPPLRSRPRLGSPPRARTPPQLRLSLPNQTPPRITSHHPRNRSRSPLLPRTQSPPPNSRARSPLPQRGRSPPYNHTSPLRKGMSPPRRILCAPPHGRSPSRRAKSPRISRDDCPQASRLRSPPNTTQDQPLTGDRIIRSRYSPPYSPNQCPPRAQSPTIDLSKPLDIGRTKPPPEPVFDPTKPLTISSNRPKPPVPVAGQNWRTQATATVDNSTAPNRAVPNRELPRPSNRARSRSPIRTRYNEVHDSNRRSSPRSNALSRAPPSMSRAPPLVSRPPPRSPIPRTVPSRSPLRPRRLSPPPRNNVRSPPRNNVRSPPRHNVRSPPRNNVRSPPRNNVRSPLRNIVRSPPRNHVRSPPRNNVRSPPRNNVRSPLRNNVRSPTRNNVRSPLRNNVRSPPRNNVRSPPRNNVRSPPRNNVRSPTRNNVRSPPRNHVRSPIRNNVRSPIRNNVRSPPRNIVPRESMLPRADARKRTPPIRYTDYRENQNGSASGSKRVAGRRT